MHWIACKKWTIDKKSQVLYTYAYLFCKTISLLLMNTSINMGYENLSCTKICCSFCIYQKSIVDLLHVSFIRLLIRIRMSSYVTFLECIHESDCNRAAHFILLWDQLHSYTNEIQSQFELWHCYEVFYSSIHEFTHCWTLSVS